MAVAASSSSKTSEDSSMVFCCRQVLLVVILALVRPSVAGCFAVGRCFCCWCGSQVGVRGMGILLSAAAFGAQVAGSKWQ